MKKTLFLLLALSVLVQARKKHKWSQYKNIEDLPCSLKTGVVGYATEYTHSHVEDLPEGFIVGVKANPIQVSITPDTIVVRPFHDNDLVLKTIRLLDVKQINTPTMWQDKRAK